MATKLSERLRYLMKHRGNLTEIDLARAASLPQPTVHHILSGATSRPHRKSLLALANALSVSIAELLDDSSINESSYGQSVVVLPLLTWEQASQWPQQKRDNPYFTTASTIFTDVQVSEEAFALTMKGSSMETLFPEGTLLIIDPARPVKDKSYVVVHMAGENEVLFKQALLDGSHIYLKSLNPHLNKLEPIVLRPEDRIVGVTVQTRINLE